MSFSAKIKDELVRIRLKSELTRRAQLSGLALSCGSLRLNRSPQILFETEHAELARHIAGLIEAQYHCEASIERVARQHRKLPKLRVRMDGAASLALIGDTGLMNVDETGAFTGADLPAFLWDSDEAKRAFLRGFFLGAGVCPDPGRGAYGLELICLDEHRAQRVTELIHEYGLLPKRVLRGERWLVYLRGGDEVTGFLALIGANAAVLQFENVRVEKETRNYVNRTTNCDNANLDKQVEAGLKQLTAIECIERSMPLGELPASLYEAAILRREDPNATIAELADKAGIRKSGMNHRLQRLLALAEELNASAGRE